MKYNRTTFDLETELNQPKPLKIVWELHVEDANEILDALADRPFRQVAGLVSYLKTSADAQVDAANKPPIAETAPVAEPPPATH